MKTWKIQHANKTTEGVKIAISTSSNESRGVILQQGQFVLSQGQNTASLDSQKRRGYVIVDENFDNSVFNLKLGEINNTTFLDIKPVETVVITEQVLEPVSEKSTEETEKEFLDRLKEAQKNTDNFINNK